MRATKTTRGLLRLALALVLLTSVRLPTSLAQTTSVVQGTTVDKDGLVVPGVQIRLSNATATVNRHAVTDAVGGFRIAGIPPGIYTIAVSKEGFETQTVRDIEMTVSRTATVNVTLQIGTRMESLQVTLQSPLFDSSSSSTGAVVDAREISEMPLSGRDYVDVMQLVPGVAMNRQVNPSSDQAAPVLGDRGGNVDFLIDGFPNRDEINGGPASQFTQDAILEFQLITSNYKAEFGHASGGIVNVITKSGTDDWHGGVSVFHRNYKLGSSDIPNTDSPFLLRWDPSVQLGGPVLKDRVFFFASAERIFESRQLNFQFPPNTPALFVTQENAFNQHSQTHDTRLHLKLDEDWGRHRFGEQMNLTNNHLTNFAPLSQAFKLPSTRSDLDSSTLMLGVRDTAMLGNQSNPLMLSAYGQFRREPYLLHPSHPELGPATTLADLFSSLTTGTLFGDLGSIQVDPGYTPLTLHQKYVSFGASAAKGVGRHTWKAGWDFERTIVDGVEANSIFNQVLTTASDLPQFGPINAGLHFLTLQGNTDPNALNIHLRNNYDGLFVQDDLRALKSLTLNLGLRWDYDSQFPNKTDFSPRLGFAWSMTPKTVVRGGFGLFYDHFRLGVARDIAGFGGASINTIGYLSFPRLLYGNPTQSLNRRAARGLGTPCVSNNLTDAQIAAMGLTCPIKLPNGSTPPYYGIDHLNYVVASGHAPIPGNTPVTIDNVQGLTGLTPQQFADMASQAIGQPPGFFLFDPLGSLASTKASDLPIASRLPISVDPEFRTPYTRSYFVGLQRELSPNLLLAVDYYHKDIRNMLGLRNANVTFQARLAGHILETVPGTGSQIVQSYGPWFQGTYDAVVIGFTKRMGKRFTWSTNYTWTHAVDNALNSSFTSDAQTAGIYSDILLTGPTDSFVGVVPLVTDPTTGKTNASGSFVTGSGNPSNLGNFVPKAGIFYNGADLDKGSSDLSPDDTLLVQGNVQLPWNFAVSDIFRAQSGFRYSAFFPNTGSDTDGDNHFNLVDWTQGRNHFSAPAFVNMDLRVTKQFNLGERRLHLYFEMFNLFNRDNPAAVQQLPGQATPFGTVLQVLPGREGQVGLRFDF